MDKFGVFNLLSSILNKSQQNSFSNPTSFTSLNNDKTEQPVTPSPPPLPLQADMIKTMTSHDESIKRVKQKNKI